MQWSTFQTILIVAFGFILFIAVLIFAGIIPGFRAPSGGVGGSVTLWGVLPTDVAQPLIDQFNKVHETQFTVVYQAHDPARIEGELVEALASGTGPDLVMLPHTALWPERNKLTQFSYQSISQRSFLDSFARGAGIYLDQNGIWALPFAIDPLVLYYNPDLLAAGQFVRPPETWEELQTMAKTLSKTERNGNVLQSAIPLGEFSNITHAKDLLSLLIMQTGNPITSYGATGLQFTLDSTLGKATPPAAEAVGFFTRFSDPTNTAYSWNTAEPEARDAFARGQAVFYLGYASEYSVLRRQNPQLSMDVTMVPQPTNTPTRLTFGRFLGLSIPRGAHNPTTAIQVAGVLAGAEASAIFANALNQAPANLTALSKVPSDPAAAVAYRSAVIARAWLDPNPAKTSEAFENLLRTIKSGRLAPLAALQETEQQLRTIIAE